MILFLFTLIDSKLESFKLRINQGWAKTQNDIITKKTFLDGLLKLIRDKIKDVPKPRTNLEARKESKMLLKTMVFQLRDKQIRCLVLKPMSQLTDVRKEDEKMITLFEKMMEQRTSTPPSLPFLFVPKAETPRIVSFHCVGVGHPVESSWKLHPETRPAQSGVMSAEPSLISELQSMLDKSERRIPDIVKGVLKDAVRKKNDNLLYLQGLVVSI